jgi:Asp-tRNA(Asn)/Glu-tRNA(Gln) amidotransferase C subunit
VSTNRRINRQSAGPSPNDEDSLVAACGAIIHSADNGERMDASNVFTSYISAQLKMRKDHPGDAIFSAKTD